MSKKPADVPHQFCPLCNHEIDAASAVSEPGIFAEPSPGDFTTCIYCGGWLKFDEKLSMVALDVSDLIHMSDEEHATLSATSKAVKEMHEARDPKVRE